MQRNGNFAHQEYALIAMLRDNNENARNVGVTKMLEHRKQVAEESGNNDDCPLALNSSLIRLFDVPALNLKQMLKTNYPILILPSKSLLQLQALQIQK